MDVRRPDPRSACSRHRSRHPAPGYTLTELLITLAVAAVLLSLGVPAFIDLYRQNQLTARTNLLLAHLIAARSEAIKRNLPVVMCRSAGGTRCTRSGRARAEWSRGWIVFVNADDDQARDPDEPLLKVAAADPAITVVYNQWWRITFKPSGRAANGSFTLCDRRDHRRRIVLYLSGRARLARESEIGGDACTVP